MSSLSTIVSQLLHFTTAVEALVLVRTALVSICFRCMRVGGSSTGRRRSETFDPVLFFFIQNIYIEPSSANYQSNCLYAYDYYIRLILIDHLSSFSSDGPCLDRWASSYYWSVQLAEPAHRGEKDPLGMASDWSDRRIP